MRLLALVTLSVVTFAQAALAAGGKSPASKSSAGRSSKSATPDGHQKVSAYEKKSGTRVDSHERTKANKTQTDNWSTKGNTNEHTGKKGTKKADR